MDKPLGYLIHNELIGARGLLSTKELTIILREITNQLIDRHVRNIGNK